ncbi:uncharacterized protein LOC124180906 [Neodiprion fabricii]|uniref:uncharacterized protein LOC124180906 n=1 Tax=Neodiprion fabricii TaxID=2872261 RepID=UPI001ED8F288|nr:uncharacterized protein LOC124180906 [Neodiprion fabricii]
MCIRYAQCCKEWPESVTCGEARVGLCIGTLEVPVSDCTAGVGRAVVYTQGTVFPSLLKHPRQVLFSQLGGITVLPVNLSASFQGTCRIGTKSLEALQNEEHELCEMRLTAFKWALVIFFLVKTTSSQDDEFSRWADGIRAVLDGCPQMPWGNFDSREILPALRHCLQLRAITVVDTLLMDDVIPILDGVNLVRYEDPHSNRTIADTKFDGDQTNNVEENISPENDKVWQRVVINKLTRLFRTHVLKIDIDEVSRATGLVPSNTDEKNGANINQGRRRRHKNRSMFPMMMMGFLFMGSILIPMGFQFLAVLGGKALILAKMALILSSIQGLKKIATSGVNYGLYHTPTVSESWHDRSTHQEIRPPIEPPYQTYFHGRSNQ